MDVLQIMSKTTSDNAKIVLIKIAQIAIQTKLMILICMFVFQIVIRRINLKNKVAVLIFVVLIILKITKLQCVNPVTNLVMIVI